MIVRPSIFDGGMQRQINIGDTLSVMEPPIPATDTTNTTLAITAAMLLNSTVYCRNPAGVSTDTFPTADSLVAAVSQGTGATGVQPGTTFRWTLVNLSANVITGAVTANTGATLVRGTVAAGAAGSAAGSKTFLINITNGTPTQTCVGITSVNANAVLSGFTAAQIALLSVGQVVTNVIAGQQGNTIIGINATAGTVTMSGNSNTSAANQTFTFSPTYTVTGLSL
jgi:hypothetical protein